MSPDPTCPYCNGAGQVSDTIGDNEFTFQCVCSAARNQCIGCLASKKRPEIAQGRWSHQLLLA